MTLRIRRAAAADVDVVRDLTDAAFRTPTIVDADGAGTPDEHASGLRDADRLGADEHDVDEHAGGQHDGHGTGDRQSGAGKIGAGRPGAGPAGIDQLAAEATLADALRADPGFEPRLTFVAEVEGIVVGQLMASRGALVSPHGAPDLPVVGLGPLAVDPQFQGRGIGSALVHAVVGAAEALDEPALVLLGDPGFYARFGFEPSSEAGILAPDDGWGDAFQVRTLSAHVPTMVGRYRYAAPFDDL